MKAHGPAQTKKMLGTFEARDKAATDLIGRYYGTSPEFTAMVDKIGSHSAINEGRRSVLREALRKIEESGKRIHTLAADFEASSVMEVVA